MMEGNDPTQIDKTKPEVPDLTFFDGDVEAALTAAYNRGFVDGVKSQ